jgi:hypothetical protein
MKLVGIMPVRNEAWCLGFTLRVALRWCDSVAVLLHACTDDSARIVRELRDEFNDANRGVKRIVWHVADDPKWDEMAHRQQMLEAVRQLCAPTHIAIIDADEFLTGNLLGETGVRSYINSCGRGHLIELPGYNVRDQGDRSAMSYHLNGIWGNRWFATAFQDSPALHWAGDRFHHREPMGCGWNRWRPIQQGQGGTLHLWGASERRLRAKHALYRCTERLRWPQKPVQEIERVYSLATSPREPWRFNAVPDEWLAPYVDLMQYLDIDAEPWQEAEVRLLLELHGRERFAGLDLLGY